MFPDDAVEKGRGDPAGAGSGRGASLVEASVRDLTIGSARTELGHVGLDVEERRPVQDVDTGGVQGTALAPDEATRGPAFLSAAGEARERRLAGRALCRRSAETAGFWTAAG